MVGTKYHQLFFHRDEMKRNEYWGWKLFGSQFYHLKEGES